MASASRLFGALHERAAARSARSARMLEFRPRADPPNDREFRAMAFRIGHGQCRFADAACAIQGGDGGRRIVAFEHCFQGRHFFVATKKMLWDPHRNIRDPIFVDQHFGVIGEFLGKRVHERGSFSKLESRARRSGRCTERRRRTNMFHAVLPAANFKAAPQPGPSGTMRRFRQRSRHRRSARKITGTSNDNPSSAMTDGGAGTGSARFIIASAASSKALSPEERLTLELTTWPSLSRTNAMLTSTERRDAPAG